MNTGMKITIAALSSMLLLGGSANFVAGAAPAAPAKTAEQQTKAANKADQLEKEEIARINKLLEQNPDDSYMVFVSNELTKKKGLETFSMGNIMPEFNTYEDYLKKASTLEGTVLQQPTGLPEGYSFSIGKIMGPYSSAFTEEMRAEAKKLGKQIYSKKVNWKHAQYINLEYKNGNDSIIFGYHRLDEKENQEQKGYSYQTAEEFLKKYPKFDKNEVKNTLVWFEKGKQFTIKTNPGNPLTKEDLIKLAETMVKK
ncbi:hypothetical protein [Paenibacillus azoreducens]|uniref:Peptidase M56 BlaR1 n=1 Tax=Paenibacillus azoreducens TaxID=116718 RepID=A0A919YKD4_9BACL|nr:hypothetical protein [Paenibacillus azoreducens]GIO50945.1 hypothetical protein J34TS1_57100 [Paenibacillus azoreducens]